VPRASQDGNQKVAKQLGCVCSYKRGRREGLFETTNEEARKEEGDGGAMSLGRVFQRGGAQKGKKGGMDGWLHIYEGGGREKKKEKIGETKGKGFPRSCPLKQGGATLSNWDESGEETRNCWRKSEDATPPGGWRKTNLG